MTDLPGLPALSPSAARPEPVTEARKAAAHSHRAYYAKAPVEEGAEIGEAEYAMDHSAYLYLMDPDGVYVHVFSPTDSADEIAAGIRGFLNK